MATELQQYRGSAAAWAAANPVLASGELGVELDTQVVRIGDGASPFNSLGVPYIPENVLTDLGDLLVATGPGVLGRLAKGDPGQRLVVQSDGSLAWEDAADFSQLLLVPAAYSEFMQKASETFLDAQVENAYHAASTYITESTATSQHSNYDTLDHMDATYLSKARALATYEPKLALKVKGSNTARISSTTLTIDPDLTFPVVAGGTYLFEMALFLSDAAGGDYKFSAPSGIASSWHMGVHGGTLALGSATGVVNHRTAGSAANESSTLIIGGVTSFTMATIMGYVTVSTAGTFGLTWAQNTSAASPGTILYKGSFLKAVRVA